MFHLEGRGGDARRLPKPAVPPRADRQTISSPQGFSPVPPPIENPPSAADVEEEDEEEEGGGLPFINERVSMLEQEADDNTRAGEEEPLIKMLTKWIAELDASVQNLEEAKIEDNSFHEDFFLSRAIEILVRNIVIFFPRNVFKDARCLDLLLELFKRSLLGEPSVHKALWNYVPMIKNEITLIGGEAERTFEREIVQLVVAMFSLFKVTPLDKSLLGDLQSHTSRASELIFELQKKEATEGVHSVQLNQEKVEVTRNMLLCGQEMLEIINILLSVDDLGSRKCLVIDATTWYA